MGTLSFGAHRIGPLFQTFWKLGEGWGESPEAMLKILWSYLEENSLFRAPDTHQLILYILWKPVSIEYKEVSSGHSPLPPPLSDNLESRVVAPHQRIFHFQLGIGKTQGWAWQPVALVTDQAQLQSVRLHDNYQEIRKFYAVTAKKGNYPKLPCHNPFFMGSFMGYQPSRPLLLLT